MISNRCLYALKAMLELAKREGSGPVSIGQIAQTQGIPARFLEAILRQLRQAGLAESVRGKDGGYLLARPAEEITMGEVLRLIEGEPQLQAGASRNGADVFTEAWEQAQRRSHEVYDSYHFRKLADQDRLQSGEIPTNYTI